MLEAEDLGNAIADLRGRRTQAEVARRGGIRRATWSLYETGKRRPREANLTKVLRGLGCTRLQLEEAAWRLRRRRLLGQERAGQRAAPPVPLSRDEPGQPAGVVEFEELSGPALSDPARRGLRTLVLRHAALLEEILLFWSQTR